MRAGLFLLILLFLGFFGMLIGFSINSSLTSEDIRQLKQQNQQLIASQASLQTNLVMLTMHSVDLSVRYIQNGTCVLGFSKISNLYAINLTDFDNYIYLNYTLKEIYLNNTHTGVPFTVLEIGPTPTPLIFRGYTDITNLDKKENYLRPLIQFFYPPINQLDSFSGSSFYFPYSYTTASKIKLSPDCVASSRCDSENGRAPFLKPNSYYPNTMQLDVIGEGEYTKYSILSMYWGQTNYAPFFPYTPIINPYNFTGTSIEFTDKLEILLLN